jgi:glycosyltransferase involved in cell wall biosynthesis
VTAAVLRSAASPGAARKSHHIAASAEQGGLGLADQTSARSPAGSTQLRLPPQTPGISTFAMTSEDKRDRDLAYGRKFSQRSVSRITTRGQGAPVVTCIMPTSGRLSFALNAVRLFTAQDYPHRELVVVMDHGTDDELRSSLPADSRIRHLHVRPGESIGMKRNRACEAARGEYIAQWDDDDWYGPGRLSAQLEPLLTGHADVTGLSTPIFFDLCSWRFWGVTPTLHRGLFVENVHGGTLVYRREVWERLAHYPDASLAEDAYFLVTAKRRGARLQQIPGDGLFMYVRHETNAWSFTCGGNCASAGWFRVAEPPLAKEDREFYLTRCAAEGQSGSEDQREMRHKQNQRQPVGAGSMLARDQAMLGDRGNSSVPRHAASSSTVPRRVGESGAARGDRVPLVTCIMPTKDRRDLVSRSIRYFDRQDYPNRELLVVDDGDDPVGALVPVDPRIRYVRLERRLVLGEKRNFACELARGSLIVHWDDDDWYAANRISYQVEQLQRRGADLCGPGRLLYFQPALARAWLYAYPAAAPAQWLAGNGLCYRIEAWRERPFANVDVGEDTRFVRNRGRGAVIVLADHRFLVGIIHGANSNPKLTSLVGWRPRPVGEVRALLGSDYRMYETRTASGESAQTHA